MSHIVKKYITPNGTVGTTIYEDEKGALIEWETKQRNFWPKRDINNPSCGLKEYHEPVIETAERLIVKNKVSGTIYAAEMHTCPSGCEIVGKVKLTVTDNVLSDAEVVK